MRKFIINIILCLIFIVLGMCLYSCSRIHERSTWGVPKKTVNLRIEVFDTKENLDQYISTHFKIREGKREGMAYWYKNDPDNECTIYVPSPKGISLKEAESIYGHEILHCIYGSYHIE